MRNASRANGWWVAGLILAACGGAEPEPRAPETAAIGAATPPSAASAAPSAGPRVATSVPREKHDGAGDAAAPKPAAATVPLPSVPPRPATIPLVPPGEESPYASAVRAGDEAFEKNDLAAAERAYESAKKLAPKRAAAGVGLARLKIARTGVALELGAGKKNAAVVQAAAE